MKTQLLYLDAHDDSASTLEKLRWSQADRVVLVWPSHGRILYRPVDLVLLMREAERRAARLGVLSHDPDVRVAARRLGLPVFDDLDAISRQVWPPARSASGLSFLKEASARPARPERPSGGPARRWTDAQRAALMLLVIGALLVLSIVIGPAAVVELSPVEETESLTLPVLLGEPVGSSAEGLFVTSRVLEVEVDGEIQVPTSGTVEAPTTAATGLATFTNRGEEEVALPEGTGLRTTDSENVRFETIELALVPAGIGSEVTVPIRAGAPGPSGNVPAGAIGAIEGVLGLDLTVSNADPTTGGDSVRRAGVTSADLRQAHAALERQVLQSANASLLGQLAEGEALAPDSFTFSEILRSEFHPAVGESSEVLRGSMTARISAAAFETAQLEEMAKAEMLQAAEPGRAIVPGSLRVDLVPSGRSGDTMYEAQVTARFRPEIDFGSLARDSAGKSPDEAASIFSQAIELARPPRFRLWPAWWPRLPLLPLRFEAVWLSPDS